MSERYTLSEQKLQEIVRIAGLPRELVREWCLASWPRECRHQQWLDAAEPGEILRGSRRTPGGRRNYK